MCDIGYTFQLDATDSKTAQTSHVFRAMASAYATAVFVIVPIDNVMTAVFDAPVAAVGGKNALSVSLFRRSAGDAIGDFTRVFTTLFVCGFSLDDKCLSNMRKVQIVVEFRCGPDFADFDAAVIRSVVMDKVRILPVFKIKLDIPKKCGLVVFDGEVIMGFTVPDQIVGDLALGQQSISGNFFTLNIYSIK